MTHLENFFGKGGRHAIVRRHVIAAIVMCFAFTVVTVAMTLIQPGWVTYLLGFPALVLILITAVARNNDIDDRHGTLRWQARRLWLLSTATGAAFLLFYIPTWPMLLLLWGVAGTWLTTPGLPPWEQYILGVFKEEA